MSTVRRLFALKAGEDGMAPCAYCPYRYTFRHMSADHVIPRALGGRGTKNYVLACNPCNNTKGHATEETFRTWLETHEGREWLALGPNRPVHGGFRPKSQMMGESHPTSPPYPAGKDDTVPKKDGYPTTWPRGGSSWRDE